MTAPDFAAIIEDAADDVRVRCGSYCQGGTYNTREATALQLAAKVPELCRTCDGGGLVPQCHPGHDTQGEDCGCPVNFMPCPDCPTIGQLLAIGAEAFDHRDYLWAVQP